MQLIPLHLERETKKFDIFYRIINNKENIKFQDNDILIISSKYLSISEGRVKSLESIRPSDEANSMSKKYHVNPKIMELIIRESDEIFGGLYGFLLTSIHGILAPNSGIDKSNIQPGKLVLYPKDPFNSIRILRLKFVINLGIRVGIVLSDSRILPMRRGTVGIALASCGFDPILDFRGTSDLFGNILKYTSQNLADCLSSMGTLIMGESTKSTPVVLIRNLDIPMSDKQISQDRLGIESKFDIYIRALSTF